MPGMAEMIGEHGGSESWRQRNSDIAHATHGVILRRGLGVGSGAGWSHGASQQNAQGYLE
jgi:hypothetical protein